MADIFERLDDLGAETEDSLERFMNDEDMYLKYIRSFPDEPSMSVLRKAVDDKNYEQAEKSVHALKGIANNLGFIPLADVTVDMLAELRAGNIEDALDAYDDVVEEYEKFCKVINEWHSSEK